MNDSRIFEILFVWSKQFLKTVVSNKIVQISFSDLIPNNTSSSQQYPRFSTNVGLKERCCTIDSLQDMNFRLGIQHNPNRVNILEAF